MKVYRSKDDIGSFSDTCDVCRVISDEVVAGRWIFYCPEHEENDRMKTYENEIVPALESGDFYDMDDIGEMLI